MIAIYSGQPITVTGWFTDPHGHMLFLQRGDLAPICPRFGPAAVAWRLHHSVAGPNR